MDEQITLGQIFAHWKQVRDDLLSTIDKFDEEELSFVPFGSSMSVGQIMLHIGDAEEGWFRNVVSGELDTWPDSDLESYPTTEAVKAQLTTIHRRTEKLLDSLVLADLERAIEMPRRDYQLSLGWIIWHVLEHEIHHRGELSLILGLLGREGLDV
jgi:uncharacterized damage-inducible protein DinB